MGEIKKLKIPTSKAIVERENLLKLLMNQLLCVNPQDYDQKLKLRMLRKLQALKNPKRNRRCCRDLKKDQHKLDLMRKMWKLLTRRYLKIQLIPVKIFRSSLEICLENLGKTQQD